MNPEILVLKDLKNNESLSVVDFTKVNFFVRKCLGF